MVYVTIYKVHFGIMYTAYNNKKHMISNSLIMSGLLFGLSEL